MNPDAYQFHRRPNTPEHRFKDQHIISDQVGGAELSVDLTLKDAGVELGPNPTLHKR